MLFSSASKLSFWLRYLPRQERFGKRVTFQVRYLEFQKNRDVQRNLMLVYYDGNALLVSFQTLILVEIPSAARAICKKCHLSGSIRWIWLKLATFREIQYWCTRTEMLCSSASKLIFCLKYFPGRSVLQKVPPVRFDTLNLKKVGDVQWNLISLRVDGNALLVSFQSLILVEIPSRARAVWKKYLCTLTEILCSSASKLSHWLRSLPRARAVWKKCHLSGLTRWIWRKLVTLSKLNIAVGSRKCPARQLPNSHSGWEPFQAGAACKRNAVSSETLNSTFSETQYWHTQTEMLWRSASKLLFWLRYLPGESGFQKVPPVKFDTSNLRKVSDVHWTPCWCRWTEMLCSSASKLSFLLRYLPGDNGLQKVSIRWIWGKLATFSGTQYWCK